MSYYLHRLRCWWALISVTWAECGRDAAHAEWKYKRDVAHRRNARLEMLLRGAGKMKTWNNEPHDVVERRVMRWAVVAALVMVAIHAVIAAVRMVG